MQDISSDIDFGKAEDLFLILRGNTFEQKYAAFLQDTNKKQLMKPEVIWNASIASTLGLAKKTHEAESNLRKQFEQVQELFRSMDILCVPATLDAAFDAEVRYPAEQLGQTFSNYLGWMMPACIVTTFLCPALVMPCGFLEAERDRSCAISAVFTPCWSHHGQVWQVGPL